MTDVRMTEYRPSSVSAPGDTLAELLSERGLSQAELARRLDRPLKTINEIVKGKAAITPETALQLERALGTPADFWLARECAYREWLARDRALDDLKGWTSWLGELPIREMTTFAWIPKTESKPETVAQCLRFFGVATVEAWRETYERPLAAFRASRKVKQQRGSVAAWLRRGEIEASELDCAPFEHRAFLSALTPIRRLTCEEDPTVFVPRLTRLCMNAGVAVVVVRAPKGCPVSGAARWVAADKALIQLSLRYKTNDQLWFTFFHEAAHVLKHGKSLTFVDDISSERDDDLEREANDFARNFLIPGEFAKRLPSLPGTRKAVNRFASEIGVSSGIVVGRMQREGLLPWSHLNDLKTKYEWADS